MVLTYSSVNDSILFYLNIIKTLHFQSFIVLVTIDRRSHVKKMDSLARVLLCNEQ